MKRIRVAEKEHAVRPGCLQGLQELQALCGKPADGFIPKPSDLIFPAPGQRSADLVQEVIRRDLTGFVLLAQPYQVRTRCCQPEVLKSPGYSFHIQVDQHPPEIKNQVSNHFVRFGYGRFPKSIPPRGSLTVQEPSARIPDRTCLLLFGLHPINPF